MPKNVKRLPSQTRKGVASKKPSETPSSIGEYIDRMIGDAEEINRRLLGAPLDMTTTAEPTLFDLIREVREKLNSAKELWGKA